MRALPMVLLLVGGTAHAAPPLRSWSTIKTSCCDITYHDGLDEEARHFARAAQEAHEAACEFLAYSPDERTQILLTDDTDFSNGSATPLPYNQIRAYARPPGSFSDLGDYDDWARGLILHEYIHIAHTDQIRGIPRAINWAFGKIYPPNMLQPRWFIEGLATFGETYMTTGGRAQSSIFEMYLRTAALSGQLWPMDILSSGGRPFPGGNGAYLYGGHFLGWIAEKKGAGVFGDIAKRYGGTVVPYALDWAAGPSLGEDYVILYDQWRYQLTEDAEALVRRVEEAGRSVERRLTGIGQSVLFPRLLPDGKVAFYAAPTDDSPGLYVMKPRAGAVPTLTRIAEVQNIQGLSPTPDGKAIIFSQPEVYGNEYVFLDLWRAELGTGELRRITAGARLRDPDVHPDGKLAMAVENRVGNSRLVLVDLSTGAVRGLFSFGDGSEIHSPRFSPRGDAVVFTAWRPGGFRDVYLLRAGQPVPERLTADRAMDLHPAFSADGKSVYFSADRDGVFNIHRIPLDGTTVERATNVVTGAFMPLPLEEEGALLYVGFGPEAFDLYATALNPVALPPAPPAEPRLPAKALPHVAISEPTPYLPFESMQPFTWEPMLRGSTLSAFNVGAVVSGQDLVGYHAYSLEARAILPLWDYAWAASYAFTGFPITLATSAAGYVARPSRSLTSEGAFLRFPEDVLRGELSAALPLSRWRWGHLFTVGYSLEMRRVRGGPILRPDGPEPLLQLSRPISAVAFTWSHNNVRSFRDSVSTERGRRMFARVRVSHPLMLSGYTLYEFNADYREYIPVPGLPRHVWFLGLSGGVARGDITRRRVAFVGGIPERNIFLDVLTQTRIGAGFLRGYPFAYEFGDGFVLANLEWRFPILQVQQGFHMVPFFVDRLRGLVFYDQGLVFNDFPKGANIKRGVGAELLVDTQIFYVLPLDLRFGMARGLDRGGLDLQLYFALGADS
ncbi:MAG: hypothetical protein AB2A00_38310 [Myxococcota bacterium]